MEIFHTGEVIYVGRPPTFQCQVGSSYYQATILKILPAYRRLPTRYEVQFLEADKRTGENNATVVPHHNKHRRQLVFKKTVSPQSAMTVVSNAVDEACITNADVQAAVKIWRPNDGSTASDTTEDESEEEASTIYTNEDHDPDSCQPWNQREHFRNRGQEEPNFTWETCMSPLPTQMPLSPPSR